MTTLGYSACGRPHQPTQSLAFRSLCAPLRGRRCLAITAAVKLPARLAERHASKAERRAKGAETPELPRIRKTSKADRKPGKNRQRQPQQQQLSTRLAEPGSLKAQNVRWHCRTPPTSNLFLEYVPGHDVLISPEQLAAGLAAYDAASGEHVLQTRRLPEGVLARVTPLVLRGLQLFQTRQLPQVTDGRASAGPVDVAAFLAQPSVQEQVQQALHRRAMRLKKAGQRVPKKQQMLMHVVHVSADQRKVYIGDEYDVTRNGTRIMSFLKAWQSLPLHTWSGGQKMADMPGGQPPKLVASQLSTLLKAEEPEFIQAANLLWDAFASDPQTAEAAQRMMAHMRTNPVREASALGRTAWNAYAFNISYRTGPHVDGKNVAGSYSALMVCEVGYPVAGGFYMLPQYNAALDIRQGVVMFHRSGDAEVGLHGNSGMRAPNSQSHRIALVLYQTELKVGSNSDSAEDDADQPAAESAASQSGSGQF